MTSSRPSAFAFTTPGPLRLYSTQELLRLPAPTWLIDGILPAGGLIGLYGKPGCGKSFLAIDMAMCVASGLAWQGHAVQRGFVLYVSAEGGTGIGKRVAAWLSSNQVSVDEAQVSWLTESLYINSTSEDMDVLFRRLLEEVEKQPTLVIIDTLARCFDGDENLQEDMGRFIAGVDRLRREFNATVIVVHHTRLDAERERGSTAFRGAADAMLSVARKAGGPLLLSCDKQKDAEEFSELAFELTTVPAFESCVIQPETQSRSDVILELLLQGTFTFSELRDRLKAHISPSTLKRGLRELLDNGRIVKENGLYERSRAQAE